jgi:hypothetical protein
VCGQFWHQLVAAKAMCYQLLPHAVCAGSFGSSFLGSNWLRPKRCVISYVQGFVFWQQLDVAKAM